MTLLLLQPSVAAQALGQLGEEIAWLYLQKKCTGDEVTWLNRNGEKGLPYDLEVVSPGGAKTFVEVKSTNGNRDAVFMSFAGVWRRLRLAMWLDLLLLNTASAGVGSAASSSHRMLAEVGAAIHNGAAFQIMVVVLPPNTNKPELHLIKDVTTGSHKLMLPLGFLAARPHAHADVGAAAED